MKFFLLISLAFFSSVQAQDRNVLLKEADNFEKQQKETEALDKYKQVLALEPANSKALLRTTALNLSIGSRQTDRNSMRLYYETAEAFSKRAWQADSNSAETNYILALVAEQLQEIETESKKIALYIRDEKHYADQALAIDPNHGRAHYISGKWHYEVAHLPVVKKAAIKLLYGGMPRTDMDSAIVHLEKCKTLEPYFVANYLALAKAYKENRQPAQAIEVLNRLVKLPTRTANDPALKAEGARLLESMQ